jgi:hypothetical protein
VAAGATAQIRLANSVGLMQKLMTIDEYLRAAITKTGDRHDISAIV